MKKNILLGLLAFSFLCNSQVINNIQTEANKNKSKPTNSQNNSTSQQRYNTNRHSSNSYYSNANSMNSMGFCTDFLLGTVAAEQMRLMSKKSEQVDISYLEVLADLQVSTTAKQFPFKPRLTWSIGLFATELRWFNLNERNYFDKFDSYNFFDWQLIMLNIINREAIKFRVGTGFSHEYYTQKQYWENSILMRLIFFDRKLNFNTEFRTMSDAQTRLTIRRELSVGLDYEFYQRPKTSLAIGLSGSRTSFYESVHLYTFGPKLIFRVY